MPTSFSNMVINPNVSGFRGFGSSVVRFSCFAMGLLFPKLLGLWNSLKIVVYCIVSFMFSVFMLPAKHIRQRFPRVFLVGSLETQVGVLVLMLLSLYSYYEDRSKQGETGEKGYRSTGRLIYFKAFAWMSMTLSTQAQLGFKVGMSNFFPGCLVLRVMKKSFMVGVGVAVLSCVVMRIHSYSDCWQEQRRRGSGEPHDIVVVGNGLLEETPPILSPLPLIIHPSCSLSTLRRWPVNLDSSTRSNASQKLGKTRHGPCRNLERLAHVNAPSPMPPSHISWNALSYVSLSAIEYSTSLSSGWDLTKALRHVRL